MHAVSINELHDLIKSLSKSEKRFFKLTASGEQNAAQITALFNELEKSSSAEIAKPSKQFSKLLKPNNLIDSAYCTILKSQRTFYAESISAYRFKDEISNLRNLLDKAQYKQCRKMLNKLKEEILKDENFNFLLEILSIEKNLLDIENKFGVAFKPLEDLIKEEQLLITKSKNIGEYAQAFSKLNYLVRQSMVAKTGKGFDAYDKMLASLQLRNKEKCLSKKAEVLYHHTRALCFSQKRDNENKRVEFSEMIQLMDKNPFLIDEYPKRYLSAINNILSVEINNLHYMTAEKLIDKFILLKNHPAFNTTDLQLKIFTSTSNAQLLIYTDGGKTDKALPVVKHINEQIDLYKDKINKEELLIFYYNFTNLYIYSDNFKEAGRYLDMLLNENDKHLRQDLQSFSRLQNILLNYELNKIPQLKYMLKIASDLYKSQKPQFKAEKLVLQMFEDLINSNDKQPIWKRYKASFSELFKDQYECIANYYIDFMAYIESKISNKKIGDIIFEKQNANWKK